MARQGCVCRRELVAIQGGESGIKLWQSVFSDPWQSVFSFPQVFSLFLPSSTAVSLNFFLIFLSFTI